MTLKTLQLCCCCCYCYCYYYLFRFTLLNKNQITVQILNYGGTVSSIMVPDKHGKLDDICLGFDDMAGIAGILTHRSVGQSVSQSVDQSGKERKEIFYLTTHSTHFIYGYMASDLW